MLLLDPVCERDRGFALRKAVKKLTNPNRYSLWLKRRIRGTPRKKRQQVDLLALRHYPSPQVMCSAFDSIRERDGHVMSEPA